MMARYDTITVGVPVVLFQRISPLSIPNQGNTWVDDLVDTKLKSLRIAPSNVCDDETYLRRVTIDLVGLLPTEERKSFLLTSLKIKDRSTLRNCSAEKSLSTFGL